MNLTANSGDYRGAVIDNIITLYHDDLKNALLEYGVTNIQYFPVILRNPMSGKLENRYWIANIIGIFECVDRENSEFTRLPSGIDEYLGPFQIQEEKTAGASVFRIAEEPSLVIMTEKLIDYLIKSEIRGVRARETKTEYSFE